MAKIVGIDPGLGGAIVLLDGGKIVRCEDMPTNSYTKSDGRIRRKVDPAALAMIIRDMAPQLVLVEAVHASPGMGVSSAFGFGHSAGIIDACIALSIPRNCEIKAVSPNAWKRAMNVPADKVLTTEAATSFFGSQHWPLKKHHGRAEAALICLYGLRLREAQSLAA